MRAIKDIPCRGLDITYSALLAPLINPMLKGLMLFLEKKPGSK